MKENVAGASVTAKGFLLLAFDSNRVLVSRVSTPCKSMQTVALRFSPREGTTKSTTHTSQFRSSLFEERAAVGSGVSFPLCVDPQSTSEVRWVALIAPSSSRTCVSFSIADSPCSSTPSIQPYACEELWDMLKGIVVWIFTERG
jgi:hypothetical protein